jgi:DnaD/phage-associated family protein
MVSFSFGRVLELPEVVVSNYINECNELQLKTLLLLVFSRGMTSLQIAGKLGVTAEVVSEAIDFWVRKKVMVHERQEEPSQKTNEQAFAIRLTSKEAAHMVAESEGLSFTLDQFPNILGRLPNQFDLLNLVDFHFNLGMEPELIMLLLKYCTTIGQTSAKAIRREARFWFESGIDSYDTAEVYVARNTELESWHEAVKEKLQMSVLSNRQKLIINRWQTDLKLDLSTIEKAIDVALEQKGEVNVPYINGILVNWARKATLRPRAEKKRVACVSGAQKEFSSFKVEDLELM